jgi:hypothetical protein
VFTPQYCKKMEGRKEGRKEGLKDLNKIKFKNTQLPMS